MLFGRKLKLFDPEPKDISTNANCHSRKIKNIISDWNEIRTHNHLVRKRKLNNLAKLVKLLSCAVSTYQYGAFDCKFLSIHVRVSD